MEPENAEKIHNLTSSRFCNFALYPAPQKIVNNIDDKNKKNVHVKITDAT